MQSSNNSAVKASSTHKGRGKYKLYLFKVCKSVHHHTIQINQPTRCNNFSSILLDVYLQLNMFWASSRPSSGAQQLQQQPLVLPSERGDSSAFGRVRAEPDRPRPTALINSIDNLQSSKIQKMRNGKNWVLPGTSKGKYFEICLINYNYDHYYKQ